MTTAAAPQLWSELQVRFSSVANQTYHTCSSRNALLTRYLKIIFRGICLANILLYLQQKFILQINIDIYIKCDYI